MSRSGDDTNDGRDKNLDAPAEKEANVVNISGSNSTETMLSMFQTMFANHMA